MRLARLLAEGVLSPAAHRKQSAMKTFPDGVSPKRKSLKVQQSRPLEDEASSFRVRRREDRA